MKIAGFDLHIRISRKWLIPAVAAGVLLVLLIAVCFLLGLGRQDSRMDSPAELLAGYDPETYSGMTVETDGSVTLRLSKTELYWFMDRYGILPALQDAVSERTTLKSTQFGLRMQSGQVIFYLSGRAWGFLPVTYRAVINGEYRDGTLYLTTEDVILGTWMHLPEKNWPALLRGGLELDFSLYGIGGALDTAYFEADSLVLKTTPLSAEASGKLMADRELLSVLELVGCEGIDICGMLDFMQGLDVDRVPADEAWAHVLASGDAENALTDLLACCTEESRGALLEKSEPFVQDYVTARLERLAAERREELEKYFAGRQDKYEKLLAVVRELYKSGQLTIDKKNVLITETGAPFDPAEVTTLPVTAIDSRIVFLNMMGEGNAIHLSDMPVLDKVPRRSLEAIRPMDKNSTYDIGFVMTTEGDIPILLHLRDNGSIVMRELSEQLYVSVLVSPTQPVITMEELPIPAEEFHREANPERKEYTILYLTRRG